MTWLCITASLIEASIYDIKKAFCSTQYIIVVHNHTLLKSTSLYSVPRTNIVHLQPASCPNAIKDRRQTKLVNPTLRAKLISSNGVKGKSSYLEADTTHALRTPDRGPERARRTVFLLRWSQMA